MSVVVLSLGRPPKCILGSKLCFLPTCVSYLAVRQPVYTFTRLFSSAIGCFAFYMLYLGFAGFLRIMVVNLCHGLYDVLFVQNSAKPEGSKKCFPVPLRIF